ncbi:MAG: peroxiredoxin family protein [Planctomycetaceae bacterium]
MSELQGLQSRYNEITDLGAEVLAVCVDSPEENAGVVKSAPLEFPILSDSDLKMIDAYGVRHVGASMNGGDVARPAVFIIDGDGNVAWRMITDNYRIRVRPEAVIAELKKLQ